MIRIGLLSDTHGHVGEGILRFFSKCDEIWHAGDIGNMETVKLLEAYKPLRAVYGNIDGHEIRTAFPEILRFTCEGISVVIKHIGGYPGHYDRGIRKELLSSPPQLFISGHSHILKVIYDKKFELLHINPGAAGLSGFHNVQTAVRFNIGAGQIKELEVYEKKRE